MNLDDKIYVAGHTGLVGSAFMRELYKAGFSNIVTRSYQELDLRNQQSVDGFFMQEKPAYVFLAAARVGGIWANKIYPADFIYDNLMIAANIVHAAYRHNVKRLLNLGSSCIYPKNAPQPIKEDYLLTDSLEPTNEPYALAKIAAIKLCHAYRVQYGFETVSLMPTNLYGPCDNFNLETAHVLPALLRKFHLAKLLAEDNFDAIRMDAIKVPFGFGVNLQNLSDDTIRFVLQQHGVQAHAVTVWGTGKVYREFLHADYVAQAGLFFMRQKKCVENAWINVGSGIDCTIEQLVVMVQKVVGFKGLVVYNSAKPDGVVRKVLDVSLLQSYGIILPSLDVASLELVYAWYCSWIDRQDSVKEFIKKQETV